MENQRTGLMIQWRVSELEIVKNNKQNTNKAKKTCLFGNRWILCILNISLNTNSANETLENQFFLVESSDIHRVFDDNGISLLKWLFV